MEAYLNASHIINNKRKVAREIRPGPIVVVVGPPCSGRTSLVKILANYAIRAGWNPLLVDTSVEQNLISVPGALSAVQVCNLRMPGCSSQACTSSLLCYSHGRKQCRLKFLLNLMKGWLLMLHLCSATGTLMSATTWMFTPHK